LAQLFEFRHGVMNSSPPATDGGPKAVGAGDNGGSPPGPTTTGQPQPMQPVSTSLYPRRLHAVEPRTRRTFPPMGTSAQNPTEEDREPPISAHRQPGQTPPSGGLGRSVVRWSGATLRWIGEKCGTMVSGWHGHCSFCLVQGESGAVENHSRRPAKAQQPGLWPGR
jgi:hypothetical protein